MPSKLNNETYYFRVRLSAPAKALACFAHRLTRDLPTLFRLLFSLYDALRTSCNCSVPTILLRKEVIQPLVLERLPCYDFTPIIEPTFGRALSCKLGYGLRVFPTLMV